MDTHFLVKHDVGAIAFIGAYTGTQGDRHTLARGFFKSYANDNTILGDAWNGSLKTFVNGPIASLGFRGSNWYTYARSAQSRHPPDALNAALRQAKSDLR
jgi:hypothetical protein